MRFDSLWPARMEIKWNPWDIRVGACWRRSTFAILCDDPQCVDSTWDHYGNDGERLEVVVCLVPALAVVLTWEERR